MWNFFVSENFRFAINVTASLILFGVSWLYFDAWKINQKFKELVKFLGFFVLSLSFMFSALTYESNIAIGFPKLVTNIIYFGYFWGRLLGYLMIVVSLILDPLQPKPKIYAFFVLGVMSSVQFMFAPLAAVIGIFFLRRGTIGLEDHIKPVGYSFLILSLYELFSLNSFFLHTSNPTIYSLVANYGAIWYMQYVLLLVFAIVLGKWIFSYLLKQFETQFFMILTGSILIIFLVTTVLFTFLLLKNINDQNINRLKTDVKVLNFAIESKKSENLSDAIVVAQSNEIISGINDSDRLKLFSYLENYILSKKGSTLIVTDENGKVLARGEDRDKYGDSLSGDPLVERVVTGQVASTVASQDGPVAPVISVIGGSPIKDGDQIIGAVISGSTLDNAFVDGIKNATGLESSIYSGNILSATTITDKTNGQRPVGIVRNNTEMNVEYSGEVNILGLNYLSTYLPLKDVDNVPIGVISIGKPVFDIVSDIFYSVQLTFIGSMVLLAISIIPSLLVSKYLSSQIK
jgi:hypothetical protein